MSEKNERIVKVLIGGQPQQYRESEIPKLLENIERIKKHYQEKKMPIELVEKLYKTEILWGEN